jgi:hypothetical protein
MKRTFQFTGKVSEATDDQNLAGYDLLKVIEISNQRDGGDIIKQETEDDEIIHITFDDGSTWMGRAAEFPELFDQDPNNLPKDRDGAIEPYIIPDNIAVASGDRDGISRAFTKILKFFSPQKEIVGLAVKKSAELADRAIQKDPGLFRLDQGFNKAKINEQLPESDKPYLLFIHGTGSDLSGSFDKMVKQNEGGALATYS